MANTLVRRLWAGLVFLAALLELRGLVHPQSDDTLSEYAWSKLRAPVLRGAITGLLAWLVYHLSFGSSSLGNWDLLFAAVGAALGVVSVYVQRRTRARTF